MSQQIYSSKQGLYNNLMKDGINPSDDSSMIFTFLDNSWSHKFKYFKATPNLFTRIIKLGHNNKYYVNEIMVKNAKRKPFLDIEREYENEKDLKADYKKLIQKIQSDIISVFKDEYNVNIDLTDILLLDSTGINDKNKYKFSIHVTISPKDITYYYTNNKFTESAAYHFYTSLIKKDMIYQTLIDGNVYKNECSLRIIGSHKKKDDSNRCLCPIDPHTLEKIDITDKEKLRYLVTYMSTPKNMLELKTPLMQQSVLKYGVISKNKPSTTNYNNKLLILVKKYHPTAYYTNYHSGCYGFSYTNRKERCPISSNIHSGTNGFYCYESSLGIYMRCHSEHCKNHKPLHIGYIEDIDEIIHDAVQIDTQYLANNDDMLEIVNKWNESNKLLGIKSPMGTGKTTLVKHIIETYEFKNILWITHRQTLTHSLHGEFKKYGFVSYISDKGNLYHHNRLFISLDSIERACIDEFYDLDDGISQCTVSIKHYDLVIIDECESVFAHISSPYLNKYNSDAHDLFRLLQLILAKSNKILFLDADLGIRTNIMMNEFKNSVLVNNNYKISPRKFEITNCKNTFYNYIKKDIKNKHKLCIISMSSSAIDKISLMLKTNKVKFVIHTSKTNDQLKEKLQDVNTFWTQYDVVLFSPTIQSGVDFNVKHFDKVYGIIGDGSNTCCQRSFLQMIGRIRHIKVPKIICLYQNIKLLYSDSEPDKLVLNSSQQPLPHIYTDVYTFDDMLNYVKHYQALNGKKILKSYNIIEDTDNKVTRLRIDHNTKLSTFDLINIHTETENLNKSRDQFMVILKMLIIKSGNTISFNLFKPSEIKKIKEITSKQLTVDSMLAINDSDYDISKLKTKQKNNKMTEDDKVAYSKHCFKKLFAIPDNVTNEQMAMYLDKLMSKEPTFKNLEYLLGLKTYNETPNIKLNRDESRLNIIIDLLQILCNTKKNIKLDDINGVKLNLDTYRRRMTKVITSSLYFKDEPTNHIFFYNCKFKNYNDKIKTPDNRRYIIIVKYLLKCYGIHFKSDRHKEGRHFIYEYSFKIDEDLLERLVAKYPGLIAP